MAVVAVWWVESVWRVTVESDRLRRPDSGGAVPREARYLWGRERVAGVLWLAGFRASSVFWALSGS